jgi:hypothetical protein
MEARSRLSQAGTPSIIVYLDKSDLSNASGDVANIFLSALNTPDYRLAMSVRTTHLVQWTTEVWRGRCGINQSISRYPFQQSDYRNEKKS